MYVCSYSIYKNCWQNTMSTGLYSLATAGGLSIIRSGTHFVYNVAGESGRQRTERLHGWRMQWSVLNEGVNRRQPATSAASQLPVTCATVDPNLALFANIEATHPALHGRWAFLIRLRVFASNPRNRTVKLWTSQSQDQRRPRLIPWTATTASCVSTTLFSTTRSILKSMLFTTTDAIIRNSFHPIQG